jgi:hypothetical protein
MNDTSDEARRKQIEIVMNKTESERLEMALQMMEDVREMVMDGIRQQNPGISVADQKIEFVKKYYKKDLSEDDMKGVIQFIKSRNP